MDLKKEFIKNELDYKEFQQLNYKYTSFFFITHLYSNVIVL